jgi:hypothetical protein
MPPSFRSSVRWVKRMKAWKKERGNGESRTHAALGSVRVYESWRARKREMTRVLHGLCISRDVGWGRESHDLHPVPARLLGVESTHRGRILLIHLIHVRLV